MRVADLIAYVNHDIDDAVRAGDAAGADLPPDADRACSGATSSARIARMVKDVVTETQAAELTEIRMSDDVLEATLAMRAFLFEAVYENEVATAEFKKATGILGGLWEKVRERPAEFLDRAHHRARRAGRRGPGFPGRHDRPVRRRPLRAAVHPQAVGRADGLDRNQL